jgi:hypothetical protein
MQRCQIAWWYTEFLSDQSSVREEPQVVTEEIGQIRFFKARKVIKFKFQVTAFRVTVRRHVLSVTHFHFLL